jgi:hypothetical protein
MHGTCDADITGYMKELLFTVALVILSTAVLISIIRLPALGARREGIAKRNRISVSVLANFLIAAGQALRSPNNEGSQHKRLPQSDRAETRRAIDP